MEAAEDDEEETFAPTNPFDGAIISERETPGKDVALAVADDGDDEAAVADDVGAFGLAVARARSDTLTTSKPMKRAAVEACVGGATTGSAAEDDDGTALEATFGAEAAVVAALELARGLPTSFFTSDSPTQTRLRRDAFRPPLIVAPRSS